MAVVFTRITIVPHFGQGQVGGFDLSWQIAGQTFSPTYQVQMGPTVNGPWVNQLTSPTANSFVTGVGDLIHHTGPNHWFKILVYRGTTLILSSPAMDHRQAMERRDYLRYREILRRKQLFFTKTPCSPGWLLSRKIYGAPCPQCLDELLHTPASSECTTCYGTGIDGGYYAPVPLRADWHLGSTPRSNNKTSKEPSGPSQVQKSKINLFPIPDAKSEDVWIDKGTRHYHLVEEVQMEQLGGSPISQTLIISRLAFQHPAYNFPVS